MRGMERHDKCSFGAGSFDIPRLPTATRIHGETKESRNGEGDTGRSALPAEVILNDHEYEETGDVELRV